MINETRRVAPEIFLKSLVCVFALISLCTLSGCAALAGILSPAGGGSNITSTAVSAFDEIEPSTKLALASPEALLEENPYLEGQIVGLQCMFHTPDPPMFVPSAGAQKGWTFVGRLNQSDTGREVQAMEYRSFFGFGSSKQQLNNWPITLVTLGQMPQTYLNETLATLPSSKSLSQKQQDQLVESYLENAAKISEVVHRLEKSYNPQWECLAQK